MTRRIAPYLALAAVGLVAGSAAAQQQYQGVVSEGRYSASTVTLQDGDFRSLLLDQSGNLQVDCVAGCSGTGSSASSSGGSAASGPTRSVPQGGNAPVTTGAQAIIPASNSRLRWSYQAEGSGYACASWVTTSPTISVSTTGVVTCGGAGAFALSNGSHSDSSPIAVETTPLTVIGSAGPGSGSLSLAIAWEAQ